LTVHSTFWDIDFSASLNQEHGRGNPVRFLVQALRRSVGIVVELDSTPISGRLTVT